MQVADPQTIIEKAQKSNPRETEKPIERESSRIAERPLEHQEERKQQKIELDKIQRQRARGGRGR